MIDDDLLAELQAAAKRVGSVELLSADEASQYIEKLAALFVSDKNNRWWWISLKQPSKHIAYGNTCGLSILLDLVKYEHLAILVATDDSYPPWPAYSGNLKCIIEVIKECRFFEYFLGALDVNELVISGQLATLISEQSI